MLLHKVNYENLKLEYLNANSLVYKKLRIVDSYIGKGHALLDIGGGTGDLIELEKQKFDTIYGIDCDEESVTICNKRFENDSNIHIVHGSVNNLDEILGNNKFDYITCLDVLEHIELKDCKKILKNIYDCAKDNAKFIFTGPGVFEKVRIFFGLSPVHLHSHSSYGWMRMIEDAGFHVRSVETVEFPIIHSDFLRKNMHPFGKCCLIVSEKVYDLEIL